MTIRSVTSESKSDFSYEGDPKRKATNGDSMDLAPIGVTYEGPQIETTNARVLIVPRWTSLSARRVRSFPERMYESTEREIPQVSGGLSLREMKKRRRERNEKYLVGDVGSPLLKRFIGTFSALVPSPLDIFSTTFSNVLDFSPSNGWSRPV